MKSKNEFSPEKEFLEMEILGKNKSKHLPKEEISVVLF